MYGRFYTEVKNFSKIESHGLFGNFSPDFFTVENTNGVISEYGNTISAKMKNQSASEILMWALNKVYDRSGNYMELEYYNDNVNGEYRISSIKYTGNSNMGINPPTEVVFNYTTRVDRNKTWVHGSFIADNVILANIEVKQNGNVVNKYAFTYDNSGIVTRLIKIEEVRGTYTVPPINITWGADPAPTDVELTTLPVSTSSNHDYTMAGDYNGDGATDLVYMPKFLAGNDPFAVFYNNKQNGFAVDPVCTNTINHPGSGKTGSPKYQKESRFFLDYDGDGDEDMLLVISDHSVPAIPQLYIQYYPSNRQCINFNTYIFMHMMGDPDWIDFVNILPGDYDGDGKKELLLCIPNAISSSTGLPTDYSVYIVGDNYPTNGGLPQAGNVAKAVLTDYNENTLVMDYDGDGKDEFCRITDNIALPFEIYKININYVPNTTTSLASPGMSLYYSGQYPTKDHRIYTGDFNGDGKKDFLSWLPYTISNPQGGGDWRISYSKGIDGNSIVADGFETLGLQAPLWVLPNIGPAFAGNYRYYTDLDFDGDGKADILQTYQHPVHAPTPVYDIFYSKGYNDFTQDVGSYNFGGQIGDFNGDGQADLLGTNPTFPNVYSTFHFRKNDQSRLVADIEQDGYHIKPGYTVLSQDPEYDYLSSFNIGVGALDNQASGLFLTQQAPIKIVKTLKDGLSLDIKYKYEAFTLHRLLGMRGFFKTLKIDNTASKILVNQYDNFFIKPYMNETSLWDLTTYTAIMNNTLPAFYPGFNFLGGTAINLPIYFKSISNWDYSDPQNNFIKLILPHQQDEYDYKTCSGKLTMYEYPYSTPGFYDHGQPSKITVNSTDETAFTYDYNLPLYNRLKPVKITNNFGYSTATPVTTVTDYTYNTEGLLQTQVNYPGTPYETTTTNSYNDGFGNLTNTTVTATGTPGIINNFTYTSDGRFLIQGTNQLNYTNHYVFDDWGNKKQHTTPDGFPTDYEYDAFNRLWKTTTHDGIESVVTYDWASNSADVPPSAQLPHWVATRSITGIQGSKSEFTDYYGHNIRNTSTTFDGQTIYQDIEYTADGLINSSTSPYFKNVPTDAIVTSFTYDNMERQKSSSTPGGATMQTTYSYGWGYLFTSTLNTTTGLSKYILKYAYLEGISNAGEYSSAGISNDIQYEYDAMQKPITINVSNSPTTATATYTTTNEYDGIGRLKKRTEPNAGYTEYTYNRLGQVVSEQNALHTFTFTYDDLGRVRTKSGPSNLLYNYLYNDNPGIPETGKLVSVTQPNNNTAHQLFYNLDGRLIEKRELVNTETFTSFYSYDAWAREVTQTYPSGDVVRNNFNAYGFIESVDLLTGANGLQPQVLWKATEKDKFGNTMKAYYYDQNQAPGNPNPNPLYEIDRTYDKFGYLAFDNLKNVNSNNLIASMDYGFDHHTGNLNSRMDLLRGLKETFTYDPLNRLKTVTDQGGSVTMNLEYDFTGNILKKTDASTSVHKWKYDKFALIQVPEPATTGTIPLLQQDVSYFPFKKVQTIQEGINKIDFTYDNTEERCMAVYSTNNTPTKTRYYADNYEYTIDANTGSFEKLSYVFIEGQLVAVLSHTDLGSKVNYVFTDHLGSITHVLDNVGTSIKHGLVEERNYDAWGRYRDPANWQYFSAASPHAPYIFDRGYTCHEHLEQFNIINMNGRLYDPLVGRMFSPDPIIPGNTNSQAYNKYSYALNNPLKHIDPSGNDPITLTVIVVGAYIGAMTNVAVHINQINSIGSLAAYFTIGAIAGGAGGVTGAAAGAGLGFVSGAVSGAAGGFTSGYLTGAANAWMNGASLTEGYEQGWMSGISGGVSGGAIGGVVGGFRSVINQRSFWNGKLTKQFFSAHHISAASAGTANQKTLNEFNACHFPNWEEDLPKGSTMSVKDLPFPFNGDTQPIDGKAGYWYKGPSKMFIASRAFQSEIDLYMAIDHELFHAHQNADGTMVGLLKTYNDDLSKAALASEIPAYEHSIQTQTLKRWSGRIEEYTQRILDAKTTLGIK